MRVKVIECRRIFDLEDEVNAYLQMHRDEKIIDIKYSGSGSHSAYSDSYYSVMVIIKD